MMEESDARAKAVYVAITEDGDGVHGVEGVEEIVELSTSGDKLI